MDGRVGRWMDGCMDGCFDGGWVNRLIMNEKITDKRREDLFLIRKGFVFIHLSLHPAKNVHFINRFLSPSR